MIGRLSILLGGVGGAVASGLVHAAPALAHAPEEIALWPSRPPGKGGPTGPERIGEEGAGYGALSNISIPRMRVYRPSQSNGRAVLLCGGGGYFRIQLWKESTPVAQWLQAHGYTAFELIYRLPTDGWAVNAPFMDATRAMKIGREAQRGSVCPYALTT